MLVLLALYYCCWFAYSSYVTAMLNSQMANIREHFVEPPGSCFFVAETTCCDETTGRGGGGDVVGTLALAPITQEPGACEMFRMVVDERYSRRGIASCLIDAVLQRAREHGYRLCQLKTTMVQRPAIALYKKKGFVITKETLYTNGHSFLMLLIKLIIYDMEYVLDLKLSAPTTWHEEPAAAAAVEAEAEGVTVVVVSEGVTVVEVEAEGVTEVEAEGVTVVEAEGVTVVEVSEGVTVVEVEAEGVTEVEAEGVTVVEAEGVTVVEVSEGVTVTAA
ncbi:unnamed protein product [Lampetra planeri]